MLTVIIYGQKNPTETKLKIKQHNIYIVYTNQIVSDFMQTLRRYDTKYLPVSTNVI